MTRRMPSLLVQAGMCSLLRELRDTWARQERLHGEVSLRPGLLGRVGAEAGGLWSEGQLGRPPAGWLQFGGRPSVP